MFILDPAFQATTALITRLPLCEARLQLDARWPWIILVPRQDGLTEIEDLGVDDRARLMDEILAAGTAVRVLGEAFGRPVEKLNVAALGNITRQLHVHVIGRRTDDAAWPNPVWGVGTPVPLSESDAVRATLAAAEALEP